MSTVPQTRDPVVCAVVACFNPGPELLDLVRDLTPQVHEVVLVDDGSTTGTDALAGGERLGAVVHHQANAGIAGALNAGVALARERSAALVLTLDQDSRPAADYVERAVATWRRAAAAGVPLAFVAAESYGSRPAPTDGSVAGFARAFDPMQSGWLVPLTTFDAVGLLETDLVIDAVDSEFTARCRAAGLWPLVGEGCALEHSQGERTPAVILGRTLRRGGRPLAYNRHAPVRVYYLTRNGTLLTRRHLRGQPRWVARRLLEESTAHLLRLLFSPDRALLARAVLAGWRDGFAGRTGRVAPALERRLRGGRPDGPA